MFERVVYVSRAVGAMNARGVYDIIRQAHNRNAEAGLTGGLVFLDGHFIQVLEGERFQVERCFARIAADPRHEAVEVRARVRSERRLFPDEWMALRQADEVVPEVLERFGYVPGLPAERFPGDAVEAFVQACCQATAAA